MLGADLDEFPADFAQLARYDDAMRDLIPARYPLPRPLGLDEFDAFVRAHGHRYAVTIGHADPRSPAGPAQSSSDAS